MDRVEEMAQFASFVSEKLKPRELPKDTRLV